MKRAPRLRFEVRLLPSGLWGFVGQDEHVLAESVSKSALVRDAARVLRLAWKTLRVRSELVICTTAHRISKDRRTYGDDPRRSKG